MRRGGAALRQRGAFACKSLSSFFFSPPNSYLSSGGRREIEVFFLLLLLTYSATVEVSSSKMVKRESTQVENESGKAYHLISKVYPMTFVCRSRRRAAAVADIDVATVMPLRIISQKEQLTSI